LGRVTAPVIATADVATERLGELLESPVWDPAHQRLVLDDAPAGAVLALCPTGVARVDVGGLVGFVALTTAPDLLLVGSSAGLQLVGEDGTARPVAPLPPSPHDDLVLNDGKVDAGGGVWAGSTTRARHPGAGSLLRLRRADGADTAELVTVVGGLTLANGLDWGVDGRLLYHADSLTGIVHRHLLADDARTVVASDELLVVQPADGLPDGLTVDAAGDVWLAVWGAGAVRRYRPDGTLRGVVAVPTPNVTSCCFGGAALDQLFITTATCEPDDGIGGAVFVAEPGVTGRPTNRALLAPT
jgi:D-xylono/L-arabinono-1,4-lactonase